MITVPGGRRIPRKENLKVIIETALQNYDYSREYFHIRLHIFSLLSTYIYREHTVSIVESSIEQKQPYDTRVQQQSIDIKVIFTKCVCQFTQKCLADRKNLNVCYICNLKFNVFDKHRKKYAKLDLVKFISLEINYFVGTSCFCF